jgi:hypothetical protein
MLASVDGILSQFLWAMGVAYALAAVIVLLIGFAAVKFMLGAYLKWRGKRLITCPETGQCAAVEVDAGRAVLGAPSLRLKECSRWPEKRDCGQECLRQIETAPDACLLRSILANWYAERECVYCGRKMDKINWLEHSPALLAPDGTSREWSEFKAETIPSVLATHQAVCWNCYVAESFRAAHPELVVERRWKHR